MHKNLKNLYKKLTFPAMLVLSCNLVHAATSIHSIKFNIGYSYLQIQDDLASPLIYRRGGIPIGLAYQYCKGNYFFDFEALYSKRRLLSKHSVNDTPFVDLWNANVTISVHRKLLDLSRINCLILGGLLLNDELEIRMHKLNQDYNRRWYAGNYASINISACIDFRLFSRHLFTASFYFPIAAYVLRNPYNVFLYSVEDAELGFSFIPVFWRFNSVISYRFMLNKRYSIYIMYNLSYLKYEKPEEIRIAGDSFLAGIQVSFFRMKNRNR